MAKRRKKKVQTKLSARQKKQLSGLLSIVRRFPRKKKQPESQARFSFDLSTELSGLVSQYRIAKQAFDQASTRSDLFKTPQGIKTWQGFSDRYAAAQSAVINFLIANPSFQAAAKSFGYP